MKLKANSYVHASNGISIALEPETDVERAVLKGLADHGTAELNQGELLLHWKFKEPQPPEDK